MSSWAGPGSAKGGALFSSIVVVQSIRRLVEGSKHAQIVIWACGRCFTSARFVFQSPSATYVLLWWCLASASSGYVFAHSCFVGLGH
jgi:hypothetical protein